MGEKVMDSKKTHIANGKYERCNNARKEIQSGRFRLLSQTSRFRPRTQRKKRLAVVDKKGHFRIGYRNRKSVLFLKDLFITLVDLKWRWALLLFFLLYFIVFFLFTLLWTFICWVNGDFGHLGENGYVPCVVGIDSFAGLLLFSIETQTSIGYGEVHPNTKCTGSLVVLFFQITFGLILETFLLSFVVTKLFRPSLRSTSIRFSKNAVICQEDDFLCLQIRVGDLREKPLQSVVVYGVLMKEFVTQEGIIYPLYQHELSFTVDSMGDDDVCMIWPVLLTHRITNSSPFWNIKGDDLNSNKLEIIVFLEGIDESTGEMCQARTSYTQKEIFWGYRFQQLMEFNQETKRWCIDFTPFDRIQCSPTPLLSAKDLSAVFKGSGVLKNLQFTTHLSSGEFEHTLHSVDKIISNSSEASLARIPLNLQTHLSKKKKRRFSL